MGRVDGAARWTEFSEGPCLKLAQFVNHRHHGLWLGPRGGHDGGWREQTHPTSFYGCQASV
jgi:hypothetical protein